MVRAGSRLDSSWPADVAVLPPQMVRAGSRLDSSWPADVAAHALELGAVWSQLCCPGGLGQQTADTAVGLYSEHVVGRRKTGSRLPSGRQAFLVRVCSRDQLASVFS